MIYGSRGRPAGQRVDVLWALPRDDRLPPDSAEPEGYSAGRASRIAFAVAVGS